MFLIFLNLPYAVKLYKLNNTRCGGSKKDTSLYERFPSFLCFVRRSRKLWNWKGWSSFSFSRKCFSFPPYYPVAWPPNPPCSLPSFLPLANCSLRFQVTWSIWVVWFHAMLDWSFCALLIWLEWNNGPLLHPFSQNGRRNCTRDQR